MVPVQVLAVVVRVAIPKIIEGHSETLPRVPLCRACVQLGSRSRGSRGRWESEGAENQAQLKKKHDPEHGRRECW